MDVHKLNEKFLSPMGESLTDAELDYLLDYYEEMAANAEQLDSCFRLFIHELMRRCGVLRGFRDARRS